MGSNNSKSREEIIIAQAGNSGGQTTETSFGVAKEVLTIGVLFLAVVCMVAFCFCHCKKILKRKIRTEIARSREQI